MSERPEALNKAQIKRDETMVHIPRVMPFFYLGLAAASAPLCAETLRLPWYVWLSLLSLALVLWLGQARRRPRLLAERKLPPSAVAAVFCLTALLYQTSLPGNGPESVQFYTGKDAVTLVGVVSAPPEQRDSHLNLILTLRSLGPLSSEPLPEGTGRLRGKILLEVPLGSDYRYGDLLSVRGPLTVPPEGSSFSYRSYLAHHGIYALSQYSSVKVLERDQGSPIKAALYRLRERSNAILKSIFPEPESALLRGILLGDESGISKPLEEAYALTGTAHIIAISGFNMAVLASLISVLFTRRLGVWKGGALAVLTLAGYTVLVGAPAAVLRAAIMGSFSIIGSSIHRRGSGLNSLGLCVLLLVLANPHVPWDIGFQLSVMATLGLILFAGPMQARLEKWASTRFGEESAPRLAGPLGEYFLMTFAAQALVLPLIAYHFRELSPLFLLANPLILPPQPLVMITGMLAMSAGLLWLGLGQALAWLSWPFAAYCNRMVLFLASLAPQAWTLPRFSAVWVLLYYLLVFSLLVPMETPRPAKLSMRPLTLLIGLLCVNALVWSGVASKADGRFHLRLLGQAEQPVALVRSPAGRSLLIGGAMPASSLAEQVSSTLPPFARELDLIIIPSCRKADVIGLYGLSANVRIRQVLWGCDPQRIQTTARLWQSFQDDLIPQRRLSSTDSLWLGEETQVRFALDEEKILAIWFQYGEGISELRFDESPTSTGPEPQIVIAPAAYAPQDANPQVLLYSSPSSSVEKDALNSRFAPIYTGDYTWLELTLSEDSLWVSAKR